MAAPRSPRSILCAAAAALSLSATTPLFAQGETTPPPTGQEPEGSTEATEQNPRTRPVVVTATRSAEDPFRVPFSTATITREQFRRRSYRTTPQALRDTPGVMVQETAHGHGSPYIRGVTSFRNLFLIDGIRLNNSVFRPGPNQYWNTVDPYSLDRLELVKGPSSVLYGSDAVGGTVNAITKDPYTYGSGTDGVTYGGNSYVRYATAENSLHGRGEISVGYTHEDGSRTGVLFGGTAKNFGDLEGGKAVGTQPATGYEEYAFDLKVEHWFDENTRLVFLHQNLAQDDVPRTHRTVNGITWRGLTSDSDLQRNFDQDRHLSYVQFHKERMGGIIDEVHASVSFHRQEEVRNRVRGSGAAEAQGFDVDTYGAFVQLASDSPIGRLTYGIELYHDEVDTFFRDGTPTAAEMIQGPVGDDATYDLLGVYVQDEIQVSDRFSLNLGVRFNYVAADADSVRDPVTSTQIALDDDWNAFVGSARFLYEAVEDTVNVFGGVSQGFRAPNLSDLSRFDSARSGEQEIPAPGLDPENYIQYEIGTKVESENLSLQAAYFYTDIEDQILRFPTGNLNGGNVEVTKDNVGEGHIQGVEFGAAWRVYDCTTLFGNTTWLDGEISNFDNTGSTFAETYPTRLMPITTQIGLRWEEAAGNCWAETVVVRAEDADKLSFGDLRDTSRIPPGGTPSYTVWHIRSGWQVSDQTSVEFLLENITDEDYRVHGSGLNRPGRNFIFGVATTF